MGTQSLVRSLVAILVMGLLPFSGCEADRRFSERDQAGGSKGSGGSAGESSEGGSVGSDGVGGASGEGASAAGHRSDGGAAGAGSSRAGAGDGGAEPIGGHNAEANAGAFSGGGVTGPDTDPQAGASAEAGGAGSLAAGATSIGGAAGSAGATCWTTPPRKPERARTAINYNCSPGSSACVEDFVADTVCSPGYERVGCSVSNVGQGNCGVVGWNDSDPTSCACKVHVGVPVRAQGGCRVVVVERGVQEADLPIACE